MSQVERIYWFHGVNSSNDDLKGIIKWNKFDLENLYLNHNTELAELTIFDWKRRDGSWKGKLYPNGLNDSMEWDDNYFQNLKLCFRERPQDVEFTLQPMDDKVILNASNIKRKSSGLGSQEEDSENMQFAALHKVKAGSMITRISWMKCKCKFEYDDSFDVIWSVLHNALTQNNKLLDMAFQQRDKKEAKIKEMATLLNKQLNYAQEEKESILKKCVLLLNSKKEQIRKLEDKLQSILVNEDRHGEDMADDGYDETNSIGLSCFSEFGSYSHVSQMDYQVATQRRIKNKQGHSQIGNRNQTRGTLGFTQAMRQKKKRQQMKKKESNKSRIPNYKNRKVLTPIPASMTPLGRSRSQKQTFSSSIGGAMEEESIPTNNKNTRNRKSFFDQKQDIGAKGKRKRLTKDELNRRKKQLLVEEPSSEEDSFYNSDDEYVPKPRDSKKNKRLLTKVGRRLNWRERKKQRELEKKVQAMRMGKGDDDY